MITALVIEWMPCVRDASIIAEVTGLSADIHKAGQFIHGLVCNEGLCVDPHGDYHLPQSMGEQNERLQSALE